MAVLLYDTLSCTILVVQLSELYHSELQLGELPPPPTQLHYVCMCVDRKKSTEFGLICVRGRRKGVRRLSVSFLLFVPASRVGCWLVVWAASSVMHHSLLVLLLPFLSAIVATCTFGMMLPSPLSSPSNSSSRSASSASASSSSASSASSAAASQQQSNSERVGLIQEKYKLVAGGAFHNAFRGPQGMDLSEYINYASGDANISNANWHRLGRQRLTQLGKKSVTIRTHPDRVQRHTQSGSNNQSMSDVVRPTDRGAMQQQMQADPKFGSRVLVTRAYACGGGGTNEKSTGANCTRNVTIPGFCHGAGQCTGNCQWANPPADKIPQWKHDHKLGHMCCARLQITYTVESLLEGACYIQFSGTHARDGEWTPRDTAQRQFPDSVMALIERSSSTGQSVTATMKSLKTNTPTKPVPSRTMVRSQQVSVVTKSMHQAIPTYQ